MHFLRSFSTFTCLSLCLLLLFTNSAEAGSGYAGEVAGWVPWWGGKDDVEYVIDHLDDIDTLYLLTYEINDKKELVSRVDLERGVWKDLIRSARRKHVEVIPTIMWFDGAAIDETLSDRRQRQALIHDINDLVDDMGFAGVDIDFEQKWAETIDHFSDFLEELDDKLGKDKLTCTIEARTPPEARWKPEDKPAVLKYANDYAAMNRHCDRIEIMAYDQMRDDLALNKERQGLPYDPVADLDWVEKVLQLALKDIDKDKVLLGIPTYGRAYDVTVVPEQYRDYASVAAVDHDRVLELSDIYDVPLGRTAGGEGFISYFPKTSPYAVFDQLPTPDNTPKGFEAAAKALLVANVSGFAIPVRILTFGDAEATKGKLRLAAKLGLRGVSFFKFDEHMDKKIWKLF